MHTFPTHDSDSWRVQALERFIDPSRKEIAIPVVAVE